MTKANKDLAEINMDYVVRHKNDYLFGTPVPCDKSIISSPKIIMTSINMQLILNKLKRGMFTIPYKDVSWLETEFVLMNSNSYLDADEKCIVVIPYNQKTN